MDMDDGAKRWLVKTARKNHWKVAQFCEVDDLIQDGYFYWYRVVDKYPDVKDKAHMMRLFQVSFHNHITVLAKKVTRRAEVLSVDMVPEGSSQESLWDRLMSSEGAADFASPEFAVLVSEAPDVVRTLFSIMSTERGCKVLRSPYRLHLSGHRETLNERLCRLVGVPPDAFDIPKMIRTHFSATS